MPSGPKKRKAAKRKKFKDSNNSNSSSTTHSHHGDCDPVTQDQHNNQLPFVEVEKHEEGLPHNVSLKVGSTDIVDEGNIGIVGKRSKYEEEMHMVPESNKGSFLEQRFVVNGNDSKDNLSTTLVVESSLVENGSAASICAGCVNEPETSQYSDKQPLVACGTRPAMQTTSWKGCCGILELLSSSD